MSEPVTGLALLRVAFPAHQISKLPKPSKKQTDELRADFKKGTRCALCGGWHQSDVVHLDYVGHAALTDRLLDTDPLWTWDPVAFGPDGLPALDAMGGLWIRLTVCGTTRLGYGDAQGKEGPNAIKEAIGDALRNAAMRFGAALDLWHKGDLHDDGDEVKASKGSSSVKSGASRKAATGSSTAPQAEEQVRPRPLADTPKDAPPPYILRGKILKDNTSATLLEAQKFYGAKDKPENAGLLDAIQVELDRRRDEATDSLIA